MYIIKIMIEFKKKIIEKQANQVKAKTKQTNKKGGNSLSTISQNEILTSEII